MKFLTLALIGTALSTQAAHAGPFDQFRTDLEKCRTSSRSTSDQGATINAMSCFGGVFIDAIEYLATQHTSPSNRYVAFYSSINCSDAPFSEVTYSNNRSEDISICSSKSSITRKAVGSYQARGGACISTAESGLDLYSACMVARN